MSREKEIWTDEVLSSLDNIQRAKVSEGFYQKTKNRIKAEAVISTDYVLRIAAGLLLLITLNVFACISFSKNINHANSEQLQAFAKEYSLQNGSDSF